MPLTDLKLLLEKQHIQGVSIKAENINLVLLYCVYAFVGLM